MPRPSASRGLLAGAIAGTVLVAAMYLLGPLAGLRPLPQLLQQPLLDVMPGAVFGFLIDNLQHAGKVVEEAGLIIGLLSGLALLGGVYAVLRRRYEIPFLGILVAAAGWLLVSAVLLPLSGDGFFGLAEGVATPLLWAVLFAVYGVVLEMANDRWLAPAAGAADPGRRLVMTRLPLAVAGGSLIVLGIQLVPGWFQAIFNPPERRLGGASPEITPVANFYVVSKNFVDPVIDAAGWSLNIHGMVEHPLKLDLSALRALPAVMQYVTLECISNNVGGNQISTGEFAGPSLQSILTMAGVQPGASLVAFRSRDGYSETLPLSLVMQSPEILVALSLGGAAITAQHGFPARILVPGHYGMKGPKWVEDIELTTGSRNGYWENQGWNPDAAVRTMARIDLPVDGQLLQQGPVALAGVAFAGSRGVSAVELSVDGGRAWVEANVKPPLSNLTWVTWTASWAPAASGVYRLLVRARDGAGAVQASAVRPSFPDGSSGYHTISVNVSH
jgi:DMSO/TMAO reductase YedYZ molybdopterin-dependent catalytic subunit